MKHTKHLLSIFLICAAFILAACSHDAPVQGCIITGKIEFKANALPAQAQSANNARMATVDGAASGFYIDCSASTVTAIHKVSGYKIRGSILNPSPDNYGYTVTIPSTGQWLIQISASYGSTSYYGETEVVVIEYNGYLKIPDYDDNYMPDNVAVSLFPLFSEGTGAINLTVKNMLTPASTVSDSDNYTVKMSWLSDKPDSLDAQYSASLSYTRNSSATLEVNAVPAGAYEVEIQFIDKNGKLVYSCNQWIHVFADLTTDTWYGTGLDYISQNYGTYLALTQEAVADYALNNPQIQYSAKSLIYKYDTNGLSYELVTDNVYPDSFTSSLSISTFTLSDSVSVTGQSLTDSFCYGNNDSVYFSGIATGSDNKSYSVLFKAGEDNAELFTVIKPEINEGEENAYAINALYYDRNSDFIYGITQGKYGADSYFPQFFVYEVKNPGEKLNFYKGSLRSNAPVKSFIVKDGYLYIPEYDSTECKLLLKCYLLGGEYNLFEIPGKNIIVANLGINHSVEISDMLCLDQDLYILVNDSFFSLGELCSRGAVIKYNFETADAETAGLAGEDLFVDAGTIDYYVSASSTEVIDLFADLNKVGSGFEYHNPIAAQSNFAPANEDAELFYGPQKILSYDNEYLYIADSGNKYILEGNENSISFKPVNRVVKFNFADMEIASPIEASDGSFVVPQNAIISTEGYDSGTLYDDEPHVYTTAYPYIPKKN